MSGTATVAGLLIAGRAIVLVMVVRFSQHAPTSGPVGARNIRWGQAAGPAAPVGCVFFLLTGSMFGALVVFALVWTLALRGAGHPTGPGMTQPEPPWQRWFTQRGPLG